MTVNILNLKTKSHIFQSFATSEKLAGDALQAGKIIQKVCYKVQSLLEGRNKYSGDLQTMTKNVVTRAMMLDFVFNGGDVKKHGEIADEYFSEKRDLYEYIPIIGVFVDGKPLFLNENYVQALGASDVAELKEDIRSGNVIPKYYDKSSHTEVKRALFLLKQGQGYKNLVLKTKQGRLISWNSFGSHDGFEVRMGLDVTYGRFEEQENQQKQRRIICDPNVSFSTQRAVLNYIHIIRSLIEFDDEKKQEIIVPLVIFSYLSQVLDRVWNDSQYLMNLTIEEEEGTGKTMICNNNYLNALGLPYAKVKEKYEQGVLYAQHYKPQTVSLIKGLWEVLKREGSYVSDFTLYDAERNQHTYSWYRSLLKDTRLKILRTVGIGNDSVSAEMAELLKFIEK